jgi:hypothetical protein
MFIFICTWCIKRRVRDKWGVRELGISTLERQLLFSLKGFGGHAW